MLKHILFLSALVAMLVVVSACDSDSGVDWKFYASDNGQTFMISNGAEVEIILEGNPSTGHVWMLDSYDAAILLLTDNGSFETDSSAVGAPGEFTFGFKAIAPGQTDVSLAYRAPDGRVTERFELTLIVSE